MPFPREILAKSVLSKSGISNYSLNCYVGCTHGCIYCYARFMKRFTGHDEPWGKFLDVKINAPEVLAREVKRKSGLSQASASGLFPFSEHRPPRVFVSSVCDAYQPIEMRYKLTRQCLRILVDAGFHPAILTKSRLVTRDFDILQGYPNCDVSCTLTTMDEQLRFRIEPGASPTWERIAALEEACNRGIAASAFLGPFMPGLSDTDEALDALLSAVAQLPLTHFYADKLNRRPGVWNSLVPFLKRYHPELLDRYRRLFFDEEEYQAYCTNLGIRLRAIAKAHGVGEKLNAFC